MLRIHVVHGQPPAVNPELKDAYNRYLADARERHLTVHSYVEWLEGRLNHEIDEARQAQNQLNKLETAPDSYRAALEQVLDVLDQKFIRSAVSNTDVYSITWEIDKAKQIIIEALGGVDELDEGEM